MPHDLLIKNGTVIDGSGAPGRRADVAIENGRITSIGDLSGERAQETLDAEGHVVAPGFIDGHTHMDAQVYWDPLGTCSSYHGTTSSRDSARLGASVNPQLPITTLVTPCRFEGVARGSQNSWAS